MRIIRGITSGQVLQRLRNRGATVTIQGSTGEAGAVQARITLDAKPLKGWRYRKVGRAAKGRFAARLANLPAGGPYALTLSVGQEFLTVRRFYVGDVWVMGGQSNMQGRGNLAEAPAPHMRVHAMYMDDHWDVAREPIHFLAESPDRVHYRDHGIAGPVPLAEQQRLRRIQLKGTGVGIYFGKEMVKRSGGIPQGLICAAHGGTSMKDWDPAKKHLGGDSQFGSMLRMVRKTGQPVAGFLWYQGESDCSETEAPHYTRRMKHLVAAIRRDFKQPHLPFITVQLGRVFGGAFGAKAWNDVQTQQYQLPRHIKNLECVSAVDLPLDDSIHISSEGYPRLGVRMARIADRMVYGNRRELPAPKLASVSSIRDKKFKNICPYGVELTFKNVMGGLQSQGLPSGFALVHDDHRNPDLIYKTTLHGNKVRLETMLAMNDGEYKIMYGHGCSPWANITDSRDMPMPVFGPETIDRVLHAV